jgi:hypothetical protein
MQQILSHLFLPHSSNNHRAKILHHFSILLCILALFLGQAVFSYVRTDYPAVLGSSIDIATDSLLTLTNQKRTELGLAPLQLNESLAKAAAMKADFMLENDFWAHNSPDGVTPWYFFQQVGYNYTYAGENLARGFTTSDEVMTAWMNSPTHKENILSPNYARSVAVKKGRLLGEDTTLIVEMFGNTDTVPIARIPEDTIAGQPQRSILPAAESIPTNASLGYTLKTTSLFNSRVISSSVAFFILSAFILVLIFDILIIQRKKIVRGVGHNMDHIFFFGAFFDKNSSSEIS